MKTILKGLLYLTTFIICAACSPAPKHISNLPSNFVSINDSVKVHYKVWGKGEQTIVFIHGFGCDMNAWEKQYEAFRKNDNYRLVFVDLPGYGLSSKPHVEYTMNFFSSSVFSVLDEIKSDYNVLVGHSLGTPVCKTMLLNDPLRISGLLDIDGVYCLYPKLSDNPTEEELAKAAAYDEAVQGFASSFDGEGCRDNIIDFVHSLAGPDTSAEITDYAMRTMPETPEYVASSTMHNLIDRRWWPSFPIPFPVEVICTQNSGLEPDNKEQMRALYPMCGYTELETCGHFIQMEQPETINNLINKLCHDVISSNLEDFDYGVSQIENNYAGFEFKVTDSNREEYESIIKEYRDNISKGSMYAPIALTDICCYFQDFHLTCTLRGNSTRFPMKWADYKSKMTEYNPQPVAQKLNEKIFLLRFPTCQGDDNYMKWVNDAIEKYRKSECENLILDVRGNGGGFDEQYQPIIELLYATSGVCDGIKLRNTKENRDRTREIVSGDEFWNSLMDKAEKEADSAYVTLFDSWSYEYEKIDPRRPKKTAVIIDKGVGSSGEQLLLDIKSVAPDVKFYGKDNTLGCIDISNVRVAHLIHAPNSLNIPSTVSSRVVEGRGLIDGIGIAPDIRIDLELPDSLTDNIDSWVTWVAENM